MDNNEDLFDDLVEEPKEDKASDPARNTTTKLQRECFEILFRDGVIVKIHPGKYTFRDRQGNPLKRVNKATFEAVEKMCKKTFRGGWAMYVINKKLILSLNGNSWLKKRYKKVRGIKKDNAIINEAAEVALEVFNSLPKTVGLACHPCPPMEVKKL